LNAYMRNRGKASYLLNVHVRQDWVVILHAPCAKEPSAITHAAFWRTLREFRATLQVVILKIYLLLLETNSVLHY